MILRTTLALAVLLSCLAVSKAATPTPKRPPNFIVIFIDNLGYGDIGPFGSKLNRTPCLDRMAAEGMKFHPLLR